MTSKKQLNCIDGVLLVDKPAGPTSHFIVSQLKRILKPERIGHLGTLDPFASGLLPVILGGATKLADESMNDSKGYLFEIALGTETDTLDPSGRVVRTSEVKVQSTSQIENILHAFRGNILQVPPAYSALKKDGRPLYEYMRAEGQLPFDIAEKTRQTTIYELNLIGFEEQLQIIKLEAICSKGTYVRCLARDISVSLGTVGHCSQLRRHKIGSWNANSESKLLDGTALETMTSEDVLCYLLPPSALVPKLPIIISACEKVHTRLLSGNSFVVPFGEVSVSHGLQELKGKCLFESSLGLQYLAEYSVEDKMLLVQPKKKIQSIRIDRGIMS